MIDFTEDFIFNGAIKLLQPRSGYRVALDPILLASHVEIKPNLSILDAGCGIGAISLILKHTEPSLDITAIDIDSDMIDLCKKNSENNELPLNIFNHSIDSKFLKRMNFDYVVTNPPFYSISEFRISNRRRSANFETINLKTWLQLCFKRLKSRGNLYIIHIAERLSAVLSAIDDHAGKIEVTPVHSYKDRPAKRVIVKCKKGSKESLKIMPPIIIHNETGEYSEYTKKILSGALASSKSKK